MNFLVNLKSSSRFILGTGPFFSFFQLFFLLEVSKDEQFQKSQKKKKSKFSSFHCWADVRRIYPALGTFVVGGLTDSLQTMIGLVLGCRAAGDRNLTAEWYSRWADGGISWGNKSKAAASTLLREWEDSECKASGRTSWARHWGEGEITTRLLRWQN